MKCISCGKELEEGSTFCAYCGAQQDAAPHPASEPAPVSQPLQKQEASASQKIPVAKSRKAKLWGVVLVLVALAAIFAAVAYYTVQANRARERAEAYEQAKMLYGAGDYGAAAQAFGGLGGYADAEALRQSAILWTAAQAAEKNAGEDPQAWEDAAATYDAIGESKAYRAAEGCRTTAGYYTAKGHMAEGRWADAQEILAPLASQGFMDAPSLAQECGDRLTFEQAEALLDEKRYYDAYKLFTSIEGASYEGMGDPSERARACVLVFPDAGAIYSNKDYPATDVELSIDNSEHANAVYKLYIGDDLVRTVSIPAGGSATLPLPAGTYRMHKAYGDLWFGTDDLFGDEGSYYTCSFGGEKTFELEDGWSYTISSGGEGTGMGSSTTDRGSF